jgi:hypothetical protein
MIRRPRLALLSIGLLCALLIVICTVNPCSAAAERGGGATTGAGTER